MTPEEVEEHLAKARAYDEEQRQLEYSAAMRKHLVEEARVNTLLGGIVGGLVGYVLGPKLYAGTVPTPPPSSALVAEPGSLAYQRTLGTKHFVLPRRLGVVSHPVMMGVLGGILGAVAAPIAFTTQEVREFFARPPLE